jgi:hypothetical protein
MPNASRKQSAYIVTGDPDTVNWPRADFDVVAPGEGGQVYDFNDRTYQVVQLDTGATAATAVGVVAANQVGYWKDKNADPPLVTNDRAQAQGGAATSSYLNMVAGVFRNAATAGRIVHILQRGDNIPCADGGNSFAVGEFVIAEAAAAAAVDRVAVGTAATFQLLGVARGAAAGGNVNVDLNIADIP